MKVSPKLLLLFSILLCTHLLAEPLERHGISLSSGWTGFPSFVKNMFKDSESNVNLQGYSLGMAYVYYGKGGPKGIFSGRFAFDYSHFNTFPQFKDFTVQTADAYMFNLAGIWTILPSLPVNLYFGLGTGWAIVKLYNWDVTSPLITDLDKLQKAKDQYGKYPIPLPTISLPIGINIRIKNFIFNVETGLRDVPYLTGGLTYAFGKSDDVRIVKETIQLPPPPPDTGMIKGRVIDKETGGGLGRAIVEITGAPFSSLITSEDGSFVTPEIKSGEVELVVKKDDYTPGRTKTQVERSKVSEVTISLAKAILIGGIGGVVQDINGNPLSATIFVVSAVPSEGEEPTTLTSDPTTGSYLLKVKPGNYTVTAKLEKYKSQSANAIVKPGFKTKIDFKLEPETPPQPEALPQPPAPVPIEKKPKVFIEKEKIVITETIYFSSGKANILPISYTILDAVADVLLKHPEIKVRIEGHTDSVGRDDLNLTLSQARAESVMKYLINKGVPAERMSAKGYGETMPIADNSTPEGRAKNRRVEFVIIK